ncbi:MAG: hypothetical protein HOZ81_00275 [Streptomyces sp.]|nr:hypothetical protein [Streptomyces sp.]NUT25200.1 hypothetical protein [Streptomyces sp.]
MIHIPENLDTSPTADLLKPFEIFETWSRVSADTSPDDAEPLVLDCARRLAADPGGDAAHVWVAGLAEMVLYLAGQPTAEAERAAVEALLAAASVFGERSCAHESHPYEEEFGELAEDDPLWLGLPTSYLFADLPDRPRQDADLCPVNIAGIARVTADMIRPFSADGIPMVVPEDHTSSVENLSSILCDYPNREPGPTLESNADVGDSLATKGARAGYVITQHASCWYAVYRIAERSVFDAMIEGLEAVLPKLGDPSACTHGDDEHPDPEFESADIAEIGFHLRSPGGRAELREVLDEYPPDAWLCPRYLRDLADEALTELRTAHTSKFGVRNTTALDGMYVQPDGSVDIDVLTQCVIDGDDFDEAPENIAAWAARRHASSDDPHERLVLLLLTLWVTQVRDLPYGVGREVRALLSTVDPAPLETACPHGDEHVDEHADKHVDERLRRWDKRGFAAHLRHLYAPDSFPAPEAAPAAADVWGCPRFLAAWARDLVLRLDEAYRWMDQEDGYEGSAFSREQ